MRVQENKNGMTLKKMFFSKLQLNFTFEILLRIPLYSNQYEQCFNKGEDIFLENFSNVFENDQFVYILQ